MGGEPWRKWKTPLRTALVGAQQGSRTGCREGSWDPDDAWGIAGGRVYTTAIKLLMLEVYYRHLPLYQQLDG